jgi:hypothetical protein
VGRAYAYQRIGFVLRTYVKEKEAAGGARRLDRSTRTCHPVSSQSQTPRSFYTDLGPWISFWSWDGVRPPLRAFRRNRAVCSDAPSSTLSGPLRREVGRLRAGPIASSRAWRLRRCRSRSPDQPRTARVTCGLGRVAAAIEARKLLSRPAGKLCRPLYLTLRGGGGGCVHTLLGLVRDWWWFGERFWGFGLELAYH